MTDPLAQARQVKDDLRARLGDDPRVRGVGITPGGSAFLVRVLVADAAAAAELALPSQIDGVVIEVVAVGEIRAQE